MTSKAYFRNTPPLIPLRRPHSEADGWAPLAGLKERERERNGGGGAVADGSPGRRPRLLPVRGDWMHLSMASTHAPVELPKMDREGHHGALQRQQRRKLVREESSDEVRQLERPRQRL